MPPELAATTRPAGDPLHPIAAQELFLRHYEEFVGSIDHDDA